MGRWIDGGEWKLAERAEIKVALNFFRLRMIIGGGHQFEPECGGGSKWETGAS